MSLTGPGEIEVAASFSLHLGPRFMGAGIRLQFHYNQVPGIHFKVQPQESDYREAITLGIRDGLADRFPEFPASASVWITQIVEHEVDSSQVAFYLAARAAIDQAHSISVHRAVAGDRLRSS